MKNFIYYENGWRWFEAEQLPVKPKSSYMDEVVRVDDQLKYNSELSALKAKSLPVGNAEILTFVNIEECPIFETSVPILQWPGLVNVKKRKQLPDCKVAILKLPETKSLNTMDSKNIKDYLHLYLGQQCRCYNHADREGWLETISCTIIIEYGDEDSEIEGIVPILRPLSDMTKAEELHMITTQDDIRLEGYPQILLKTDSGETFRWMLSKGFDLFGLIDAGLAIKKSQ